MIFTTRNTHAVKTQLYRWYNGYERPFTKARIANQLDLLTEDIHFITPNVTLRGKTEYTNALAAYKGMRISHQIEEAIITEGKNNQLGLFANILYHGIQSDGTDNYLHLVYDNQLILQDDDLPLFKRIQLDLAGGFESPDFEDSYPTTRSLALMHYYLYNIEKLSINATPFAEILTDDFQLNLSPETVITSLDSLSAWLQRAATEIAITSHHPKNVSVEQKAGFFELKVDFDWEGWTKTNKKRKSTTRHIWKIVDDEKERFARIHQIEVINLSK